MKGRTAVIAAVVSLAMSTSCGDGGAEVLVKGFRFQPKEIVVPVAATVSWNQEDNTLHTITSGTPGNPTGVFDHRDFGQGDAFSFEFDEAGTFRYFCANHPEGMRGTVRVG